MLPLEKLKRKNGLGNSRSPTKTLKPEDQKTFREQVFTVSDKTLNEEIKRELKIQKDFLRRKLQMTMAENNQIMEQINFYDPYVEGLIENQVYSICETLKDETLSIFLNNIRASVYKNIVRKHCQNVFNNRMEAFPPLKSSTHFQNQTALKVKGKNLAKFYSLLLKTLG